EAVCRAAGDWTGLTQCVGNRAIVQRHTGDLTGALASLDEQLRLAQQAGNAQSVLIATANRGEVLGLLGRVPEALQALDWARRTAAQYGLAPMVQQLDAMIAQFRPR
ncbi:MAG: tetratricopeptide repeat protein, partial [Protaetiibacter sp.]